MFKENGALPDIEIIYPSKRASSMSLLMWPAAIILGGLVGLAAFYGIQSYHPDSTPITTALAAGTAQPQPSVVPSAYVLLQGSTPSPSLTEDPTYTQADVPVPVPTPREAPPVRPVQKPTASPVASPSVKATATPPASPSATPTPLPPKAQPTPTPTSSAKPPISAL